ncbi:hypothetical protein T4A_1767 [Trichinella pseudospiralis]|uniref:Uncharacterized protein n=1 Tax=Trichinella pseudospiralis TaxID=6337 RepID=A0A0V1DYJ0_TRIPS|nr:hypothetical protein T4A_1767 [Trichinella pseudospiralis]KRZ35203.1 hypothetical protein T4C_5445 [Trichinella pseudospiralis]
MVNLKSDSVTVVVDSVGDNNTTWTVLLTSTAGWQSITGRAGLGTGHGQRQAELLLLELCALKIGCQCSNEKMKMKKKKKKKRIDEGLKPQMKNVETGQASGTS